MNKYISTLSLFLLSVVAAFGQAGNGSAEKSDDKLFVVATVLAVIFAGIALYLFMLDRKISRIEKERKEQRG